MYLIVIALVSVLILCISKYRKATYGDSIVWNTLPGPSYTIPFFGCYDKYRDHNTSEYFTKWAKQYGPIYRFYMFGKCQVLVSDPALVKYVLLNNQIFDKNMLTYSLLGEYIGNGLVTQQDEALHKYHRSIISPAFSLKHLKGLVPVFQQKGTILVEDWLKVAGSGIPVLIKDDVARAASDAIGETAFGYKLNAQRNDSPNSVLNVLNAVIGGGINMMELIPLVKVLIPSVRARRAARDVLDTQVQAIVTQKTEKRAKGEQAAEGEVKDLLDILMDCQNEEGAMLNREELCAQTKTFLMAGYETSSTCIQWTMYVLAKHKDIQEKLAEEVISVLGKDRKPTAEDIDKMPYLYKVLRESLRYCPPIPSIGRQTSQDVTLGDYFLPKGTQLIVDIHHQHHHSPVWVNPEKFDPERWATDEAESSALLGSYLPFIMGARNCIGSRFAMLEVRIILAMIVQKLRFERIPGDPEVGTRSRVAMVPSRPIKLLLTART